jgi:hypothetical protein
VSVCTNVSCLVNGGPSCSTPRAPLRRRPDVIVEEVECIAACDLAPVMQVNYEFHGPLTPIAETIVDEYKAGRRGAHHLRVGGADCGHRDADRSTKFLRERPDDSFTIDAALAQRRVRGLTKRSFRRADDIISSSRLRPAWSRRRRVRHRPEVVVPAEGRVPALPRGQR